jgi:hypothetical protein
VLTFMRPCSTANEAACLRIEARPARRHSFVHLNRNSLFFFADKPYLYIKPKKQHNRKDT